MVKEPWRCMSCARLMYNKTPDGYPCEGAPIPLWASKDHTSVCSVCYEMHAALNKADWTYWTGAEVKPNFKLEPERYERHF